ncbi:MAG TPA: GAF domain-containing sensor histidine kinase [Solirubrobacterales bacterium]|nr:GAF domain-containing sensor histidine kinase [Solirubrobacterales bacterium]
MGSPAQGDPDHDGAPPSADVRARRLVEIGSSLVAELDLEVVLRQVVEAARELTGAEYAALGVLDPERRELERFIYLGIDEATRRAIGPLPRGRGVLGELIREQAPLRLPEVEQHPHSYGFPPGHPPMHTFLGVPIVIRGEAYGDLYMCEKAGGAQFDAADEEAAATLAGWAAIAIENARLYKSLSERETELSRALRRAESSADIARAVGGETDLARVLGLIVRRARALVEARTVLVLMRRGERLVFAGHAGDGNDVTGLSVPVDDDAVREAIRDRVVQHLPPGSPASAAHLRERVGAEAAVVVPLLFRGRAVGALVALDREAGGGDFDAEDMDLLQAFAASAATAIGAAQTARAERLQQQVEASEAERRRWARELHDGILQNLAAVRISLAAALQGAGEGRAAAVEAAAEGTAGALEEQITELSRLIDDLRPATLERLGLPAALEALAEESGNRGAFTVDTEVDVDGQLTSDEERGVYRLAQEALTNVVKHSAADRATLRAHCADGVASIEVRDDGAGFDPEAPGAGRGLLGMRERVAMLGGTIEIDSRPGEGTRVAATLPLRGT